MNGQIKQVKYISSHRKLNHEENDGCDITGDGYNQQKYTEVSRSPGCSLEILTRGQYAASVHQQQQNVGFIQ